MGKSKQILREAHKAGNRITVYLFKESLTEAELLRVLTKLINNQAYIITGITLTKIYLEYD